MVWLPMCLGFLTCLHKLMHGITHGGCTDTVRESALEVDWKKNPMPHWVFEPMSVLCLFFQSDTLLTELSLPLVGHQFKYCEV